MTFLMVKGSNSYALYEVVNPLVNVFRAKLPIEYFTSEQAKEFFLVLLSTKYDIDNIIIEVRS